jgi:hypothetical protein
VSHSVDATGDYFGPKLIVVTGRLVRTTTNMDLRTRTSQCIWSLLWRYIVNRPCEGSHSDKVGAIMAATSERSSRCHGDLDERTAHHGTTKNTIAISFVKRKRRHYCRRSANRTVERERVRDNLYILIFVELATLVCNGYPFVSSQPIETMTAYRYKHSKACRNRAISGKARTDRPTTGALLAPASMDIVVAIGVAKQLKQMSKKSRWNGQTPYSGDDRSGDS